MGLVMGKVLTDSTILILCFILAYGIVNVSNQESDLNSMHKWNQEPIWIHLQINSARRQKWKQELNCDLYPPAGNQNNYALTRDYHL